MKKIVALLILTVSSIAAAPLILVSDKENTAAESLELLRGNIQTIEEALASAEWTRHSSSGDPNLGLIDETVWFRFTVEAKQKSGWVFLIQSPVISELDMFQIDAAGRVMNQKMPLDAGIAARLKDPANRYRLPFFQVQLESGRTAFIFRVRAHQAFRFPLRILTPESFQAKRDRDNMGYGLFFGALLIMTLYHLAVYSGTREKGYLSYAGLTLSSAFFFFAQQGFAAVFSPSISEFAMMRLLPAGTALYCIWLGIFARAFLRTEQAGTFDRFLKVTIGAALVILCLTPFKQIPFPFFPRTNSLIALLLIGQVMAIGIYRWKSGYTPAKFFVLAFCSFAAGAVTLILEVNGVLPHNALTEYGLQGGVLVQLTLFAFALSHRINLLRHGLEISEKKYRTLVEDTRDLVFSLDGQFRIVTINSAARNLLGYEPDSLTGKSLNELLYRSPAGSSGFQDILLRDWLSSLKSAPVTFQARLAQKNGEPVKVGFRLEAVGTGGGSMILGRGSVSINDSLLEFLKHSKGRYTIPNYVTTAELINRRITRNLGRYFSTEDADNIEYGLREILTNAVEHGNLEITYDEKTAAQKDGSYLDLIARRQKSAALRERKVDVWYSLNSRYAWFRVKDEGAGFDHASMAKNENERLRNLNESHGRGIGIARAMFDLVLYNERGNEVTLVKYVRGGQPDAGERTIPE